MVVKAQYGEDAMSSFHAESSRAVLTPVAAKQLDVVSDCLVSDTENHHAYQSLQGSSAFAFS